MECWHRLLFGHKEDTTTVQFFISCVAVKHASSAFVLQWVQVCVCSLAVIVQTSTCLPGRWLQAHVYMLCGQPMSCTVPQTQNHYDDSFATDGPCTTCNREDIIIICDWEQHSVTKRLICSTLEVFLLVVTCLCVVTYRLISRCATDWSLLHRWLSFSLDLPAWSSTWSLAPAGYVV